MNDRPVRVRFAPSPTGPLHIGGVRTALYNFLFARRNGGKFILRIEDTDQTRFVPGAEDYIIESLTWCGITFDEGVHIGGPYGPYRQSDRKALYRQYADELISKGHAYFAFDTPEELEAERKANPNFQYDSSTRSRLKNSLTLPPEEVSRRIDAGEPYVIRALIPANEIVEVNDHIRGIVQVNSNLLDDKVLYKSDGMPTYHLANIVDDHLMEITHVIRGEEWLPSAPLHVLLYRFFGWQAPEFAHLPLLLKPDGNGKLSKRDGDRLGFPVYPLRWTDPKTGEHSLGYRESGYYPEAFINMLALLGWNPGNDREIFTMDELVQLFSLDRVGKSGSRFDPEKARWFNQQYLRMRTDRQLAEEFLSILKEKGIEVDLDYVEKVVSLIKDRVNFVKELWDHGWFFFEAPETYDPEVIKKRWKTETPAVMEKLIQQLAGLNAFDTTVLDETLKTFLTENQLGMGAVMNALRLCLTGASIGPHLTDIMAVIGKEETLHRIRKAIDKIA
ncbi:MAG: glutamyl-tRNA synthetase [Bacteroidales bacterium]|jgi:glutamyl-tRNA synthetase|nr:glutamyl-tRNA synthetase [Bacteroidales bacterium]MDN5328255.1 glutamyl-tRNA synthetase [Bacteroidales bacterium]